MTVGSAIHAPDSRDASLRCPHCGQEYAWDSARRCYACDGPACPHCLPDDPVTLCPECRFGPLPAHLEPMLATNGDMPRSPSGWSFEYKWDGMRALCYWQNGLMRLETRSLRDVTALYPDLSPEAGSLPVADAIFDGEVVALDEDGRPSFRLMQQRMHATPRTAERASERAPVHYFLFDLLWHDGRSLLDAPYKERRRILEGLSISHPRWRVPAAHMGDGKAMLAVARQWGLEGVMAKRPDSPYEPGVRGKDWIKVKIVHRQEFVIGGWEPQAKFPSQVGSLLLGYYAPEAHGLRFVGRVGTGFDAETQKMLVPLLQKHEQAQSPFAGRAGGRKTRFVAPRLVAEVEYRRWPEDGLLQQSSFAGLRSDIPPHEIVVERSPAS